MKVYRLQQLGCIIFFLWLINTEYRIRYSLDESEQQMFLFYGFWANDLERVLFIRLTSVFWKVKPEIILPLSPIGWELGNSIRLTLKRTDGDTRSVQSKSE